MKNQKGITLIALVVTIIVLLILAGVAIAMLSGENGLLNRTKSSAAYNYIGAAKDEIGVAYNSAFAQYLQEKYEEGNSSPTSLETAFQTEVNKLITDGKIHNCTITYTAAVGSTKTTVKVSYTDDKGTEYYTTATLTSDAGSEKLEWTAIS